MGEKQNKKCLNCEKELKGKQRKYCSKKCQDFYRNHKNKKRIQYLKGYLAEYYQENKDIISQKTEEYRKKNKERITKYTIDYYNKNKEKIKEKDRKYYKENEEEIKKRIKRYRENNKEKVKERIKEYRVNNKEKIGEKNRRYFVDNKKKIKKQHRRYRENNKKKVKEQCRKYWLKNKEKIREKDRERYRKDPTYRMNECISSGIFSSLKSKGLSKNGRHWEDLVGYMKQQLKEYLEKLFQPGMTWNNYGKWHLDHIIPISFFKFKSTNDVEFLYCWSFNNLQPLWAKDNLEKGDRIILWGKEVDARNIKK